MRVSGGAALAHHKHRAVPVIHTAPLRRRHNALVAGRPVKLEAVAESEYERVAQRALPVDVVCVRLVCEHLTQGVIVWQFFAGAWFTLQKLFTQNWDVLLNDAVLAALEKVHDPHKFGRVGESGKNDAAPVAKVLGQRALWQVTEAGADELVHGRVFALTGPRAVRGRLACRALLTGGLVADGAALTGRLHAGPTVRSGPRQFCSTRVNIVFCTCVRCPLARGSAATPDSYHVLNYFSLLMISAGAKMLIIILQPWNVQGVSSRVRAGCSSQSLVYLEM